MYDANVIVLYCIQISLQNVFILGDVESCSQATLDDEEKSEISVHTKAPEIIGRLTCGMWIYCNGI